ncbi:MAG: Ppx/GppA phosphatase family protein [Rhodospirillaceae bacterium]|nr:Ppx/GppA phosphatase family protein [Rhodospirillaceae bacterium]
MTDHILQLRNAGKHRAPTEQSQMVSRVAENIVVGVEDQEHLSLESLRSRYRATRIAVIDIGSNSIRLVAFEGAPRAPTPIFNEKVMCGLGRGMESSGRLNPGGVGLALDNLGRFVAAASAMGVARVSAFATAAVRDAEDGLEFITTLKKTLGLDVRVLSGEEEARLSAYGVVSGFANATGLVGDLGGGSLELVRVSAGAVHEMGTLPLGALRLNESMTNGVTIGAIVKKSLGTLDWLDAAEGETLYAVGGAWRALAKVHMAQSGYSLRMIDGYGVSASAFTEFAKLLARQSDQALSKLPAISSKRTEAVRASSIVLRRVVKLARPKWIVFIARGVREGLLYEALDRQTRSLDPLLTSAAAFGQRFGRFTEVGPALSQWTDGLFPNDVPRRRRLRHAACELGDTGWFDHPDYRHRHAWGRILTSPLMGLDHGDRAFLALVAAARYRGGIEEDMRLMARNIGLDENEMRDARALGEVLRLGYTITAGQPDLLHDSRFVRTDTTLTLHLPEFGGDFIGNVVQKRFNDLAGTLRLEPLLEAR